MDALLELLQSFSPMYACDPFAPAMRILGYTPLPWLAGVFSFDNIDKLAHAGEAANAALPIPVLGAILEPAIVVLVVVAMFLLFAGAMALWLWTIALGVATLAVLLAVSVVVAGADFITSWAAQLRGLAGHLWT